MSDLKDHVEAVALRLTNGADDDGEAINAFDYLSEALDIEYTLNSSRECIGGRILVAFGGPNIWIDTRTSTVDGYWYGERAKEVFDDCIGLNDALIELFNC